MNFLPRDICEQLVELGCKSEAGFYYIKDYLQESVWQIDDNKYTAINHQPLRFPAFIFQDFCGISEQSKRNRQILWPNFDPNGAGCEWEYKLFDMLKMTHDEWVEFMRKTIK